MQNEIMLVIGITGGIASGKSLVAGYFRQLGAVVLDADKLGHEVLELDPVMVEIRSAFGDSVFLDQGGVSRKRLADIVFNLDNPGRLETLEKITHPRIRKRLEQQLNELKKDGKTVAAVLDVPLLFKSGWHELCDQIVYVDVPDLIRLKRATEIRNWDPGELSRREQKQTNIEEKKQRSDEALDNSLSMEATFEQVAALWNKWKLPAIKHDPSVNC